MLGNIVENPTHNQKYIHIFFNEKDQLSNSKLLQLSSVIN